MQKRECFVLPERQVRLLRRGGLSGNRLTEIEKPWLPKGKGIEGERIN